MRPPIYTENLARICRTKFSLQNYDMKLCSKSDLGLLNPRFIEESNLKLKLPRDTRSAKKLKREKEAHLKYDTGKKRSF